MHFGKVGTEYICRSVLVAARSEAWVCVRSLAGIVGSNPAGVMDVCCECCVLSGFNLCETAAR